MPTDRACPICGIAIQGGMLMCRTHWFRVPVRLRAEVNDSWRALRKLLRLPAPQRGDGWLAALKRYREAHDSAIAIVRDKVAAERRETA